MTQINENGQTNLLNSKSINDITDGKDSAIIKPINGDTVHKICSGQVYDLEPRY